MCLHLIAEQEKHNRLNIVNREWNVITYNPMCEAYLECVLASIRLIKFSKFNFVGARVQVMHILFRCQMMKINVATAVVIAQTVFRPPNNIVRSISFALVKTVLNVRVDIPRLHDASFNTARNDDAYTRQATWNTLLMCVLCMHIKYTPQSTHIRTADPWVCEHTHPAPVPTLACSTTDRWN